jgi:hypothetical protein
VINEERAFAHGSERAVLTGGDLTHIVVVAHAEHHSVLILCRSYWGWRNVAVVLILPGFGAGGGAVKYGHLMPCARQVTGHGVAHGTQSDESDAVR